MDTTPLAWALATIDQEGFGANVDADDIVYSAARSLLAATADRYVAVALAPWDEHGDDEALWPVGAVGPFASTDAATAWAAGRQDLVAGFDVVRLDSPDAAGPCRRSARPS